VRERLSDVSRPLPLQGRARFLVEVSSPDAKLYIDDKLFKLDDGRVIREFRTPKLQPGKRYSLNLRVETVRDGQTASVTRRMVFEGDTEHRLFLAPEAAASPTGAR